MKADYLLTGVTGQIGRYILQALLMEGYTVAVVTRKPYLNVHSKVTVYQGDLNDSNFELPEAQHIINASGHTSLADADSNNYWKGNIMPAIRLAQHAQWINARSFHQLSSVAVAEFRGETLHEFDTPIPDERQLTYSTSKVLVELAVRAILPDAQILRVGDVVPPERNIDRDMRGLHWLPILFSYGHDAFQFAPPEYSVWLSDVEDLAHAIVQACKSPEPTLHLLGHKYSWAYLQEQAVYSTSKSSNIPKWMTDIILYGPEADEVSDKYTHEKFPFDFIRLDETYWEKFAIRSTQRKGARNG